ncbi:MAG TPA: hypothetical protein DHU87_07435 [Ruminococcus sp.]|jgi:hypothetical protein|uniref:hypothetical protein n=1 Tax=Ruminococcus sp. TaxID=41978 RepID=UPI000E8AE9ED|nr:hypothetical protein [Ruminococcus sp.]HBO20306.1 hypothetical protein [Ruminococcus sp.]HCY66385.1 hypothetical protein [Ruminococcus sp.]
MKISKLKKICSKAAKTISYFYNENDNSLWIGSGSAIYPLYGMPNMNTSEQLLTLFDINESDRENWRCKQLPPAIESSIVMNIASCTTGKMIDRRSTFVAMLSEYQIFSGTEKVHICPKAFLEVIDDYEILTYYSIDDMIIVKAGLLTLGVLCETHGVVTQELLNDINSMHDMLQEVFNRECEEKDKSRNYEQLAMTE